MSRVRDRAPFAVPTFRQASLERTSGTRPAEPRPPADQFSSPSRAPVELPTEPPAPRGPAPVFTGFDAQKLASPLKLQADGQPKSAKYTFAKLAQASGVMPQSKAEAEAWFNQHIRAGMEEAGFKVGWVKGDKAFICTRENPQGEVVDFVRGAGSNDPNYIALAWQAEGGSPGTASSGGVSGASGGVYPRPSMPAGLAEIFAAAWAMYQHGLRAGATAEERAEAVQGARDMIIKMARERGIDLGWNMKRGDGPLSTDAFAYRMPDGQVAVIDFAKAWDDLDKPVEKFGWLPVGGAPGFTLDAP